MCMYPQKMKLINWESPDSGGFMYREGKLKLKYAFDENGNIMSVTITPYNRNSTVVEITNALTSALVIQLSDSLHIPQGDVAEAIVESVKNLLKEKNNVRETQGSQTETH